MSRQMEQATITELTLTGSIKNAAGVEVFKPTTGQILTDTVTGTKYTLVVESGVLQLQEV